MPQLKITNTNLPGLKTVSASDKGSLISQFDSWSKSDFAGFRRLVEPNSDCYPNLRAIEALKEKLLKLGGIKNFVQIGIGGSSLGAETIVGALGNSSLNFSFLDNNDPSFVSQTLQRLNPIETFFFAVSKTGTTPEVISPLLYCLDWSASQLGTVYKKHFAVCTNPNRGDLRELTKKWNLESLEFPDPVGGRFSALCAMGLFPASLAGISPKEMLSGAHDCAEQLDTGGALQDSALSLACHLADFSKAHPLTIFLPYSSRLRSFSRWFCQLWAESLGKNGKGLTPYPAIGTTDQHSQVQLYMEGPRDKIVVFTEILEEENKLPLPPFPEDLGDLPTFSSLRKITMGQLFQAELNATRQAFTNAGIPNVTIEISKLDAESLGALIYFWEWTTAIAGARMKINPFDQPGVEMAKILTKQYLSGYQK